jgi:hypothetical protein
MLFKRKGMSRQLHFLKILLATVLLFSCKKKYPDGPPISIRSPESRVANTWQTEKVLKNGSDVTADYTNIGYTEVYEKNGNYSYSSNTLSGSGKWMLENRNKEIKRNGVSGQPSVLMTILRLKEKSFWYYYTDGGVKYEFHLVPK